jgi:VIT1/CCC1 family predicted Fe2+/Mn2+ transporter
LIPWFFSSGTIAVLVSIVLGATMAIAIGVSVATFTGRSKIRTAARQLAIATLAAAVTYGVGTAVGVHTA